MVSFPATIKSPHTLHFVLLAAARKSWSLVPVWERESWAFLASRWGAKGFRPCGFLQGLDVFIRAFVVTFINSCLKKEPLFLACPDGRLQGQGRKPPLPAFGFI